MAAAPDLARRGKERLGGISKMGDRYIHQLLILGATSTRRYGCGNRTELGTWVVRLADRKPTRLVTVALTNKVARIAWAVMARGESCRTNTTTP